MNELENTKSPESVNAAAPFEEHKDHSNKIVAITGGILVLLSIMSIAAFLLIGYLAVPLVKEKAAWTQNETTRKANLDEILSQKRKNYEEISTELDGRISGLKSSLSKYAAEYENIAGKQKDYDVLCLKITDVEEKLKKLYSEQTALTDNRALLLKDIENNKNELNKIESQRHEREAEYKATVSTIEKTQASKLELQKIESQLKETQNNAASSERTLQALKLDNQQLTEKITSGQQKLKDDEAAASAARNELKQLNENISQISQKLANAVSCINQLDDSKAKLSEINVKFDQFKSLAKQKTNSKALKLF
jgi:chromosome segregation ATPase